MCLKGENFENAETIEKIYVNKKLKIQTKVGDYELAVFVSEKFISEEDKIPAMNIVKIQPRYILVN